MNSRPMYQSGVALWLTWITMWFLAPAALSGCGGTPSDDDFVGSPSPGDMTTVEKGDGGQSGSGGSDGSGKDEPDEGDAGGGGPSASNEISLGPAFAPGGYLDLGFLSEVGLTRSETFAVRNEDTSRVITAIRVDGEHASDFQIAGDCRDGIRLAPNATCTLVVIFAPTGRGKREAFLEILARPEFGLLLRLTGQVEQRLAPEVPPITGPEDVAPEDGSLSPD